jgi:long-subunit acyl-CoA synthetase (AMP-forming)
VTLDGWGGKVRSNRPDNSYSSSDLFVAHPSIEGAYKFVGRIDDTLTLVNGEKCQPTGMELSLKGDSPYISEAVVFGIARPHVGALLLPTDKGAELLKEENGESKFFNAIWPIIEKANVEAPSHGKLLPEMLIVLPVDSKLPRADKASIIRPKVYKMFESEIDNVSLSYRVV